MFHDHFAAAKFEELQKEHCFQTVFETGTHLGHGSSNAAKYCRVVCTVEVNPQFRAQAILNWLADGFTISRQQQNGLQWVSARKDASEIVSFEGMSPVVLKAVLDAGDFPKPFCFYLDAHWFQDWPLLRELKVIAERGLSDALIIIHDCQVPGKDFGFDQYGEQPLSYEYVKDALAAINPEYRICYNEKVCDGPAGRGILYAIP